MNAVTQRFTVDDKSLIFHERKIEFPWPIAQVIEFDDVLVVRLEPDHRVRFNQNIYAIDQHTGDLIWQIKSRGHVYGNSSYTFIANELGTLTAYNWDGWDDTINLRTGEIVDSKFMK